MAAPWTLEQKLYLESRWGSISIPAIAKKLQQMGRPDCSVNSVKLKAYKMGLGRHIHSGDYITVNQLCQALKVSYNHWTLDRWINHGFPFKTKKSINAPMRIIYMKDFCPWAAQNKMLIDWARVEPNILGPEPRWVAEKRKADKMAEPYRKRRPWTPEEDERFIAMLNSYRYTYRDISVALKRPEGALKGRFRDLNLKQRPLIADKHNDPWTPEQVDELVDLYYKGYMAEVIAEFIPKSALAIKAKIERMQIAGELDKNRYREEAKQDGERAINLTAGVHYRKALPPEKWPRMEKFLAKFAQYVEISEISGRELNPDMFIEECRKVGVVG